MSGAPRSRSAATVVVTAPGLRVARREHPALWRLSRGGRALCSPARARPPAWRRNRRGHWAWRAAYLVARSLPRLGVAALALCSFLGTVTFVQRLPHPPLWACAVVGASVALAAFSAVISLAQAVRNWPHILSFLRSKAEGRTLPGG